MTKIMYECEGPKGEYLYTAILEEAKKFVKAYHGSYKLVNETMVSSCEAHSIKGHRTI